MDNKYRNDWQAAFDTLIDQGTSPSTKRAYRRDEAYFWRWMKTHLQQQKVYPATSDSIIQFCLYHLVPDSPYPLKISTLRRYLASISIAHQKAGFASPTTHPSVKLLLTRSKAAKKERTLRKAAITSEILTSLLQTCDESLIGTRDRALLLVGFMSGGRRRQELSNLDVSDLTPTNEGYLLTIVQSKTDQTAEGHTVPLTGEAALAVKTWLMRSGLREGRLFRGIKKNGAFYQQLTGKSINLMVKKRIAMIGLDADKFGAHSLRAGFITSMTQQGINLHQAMQYSGHRDIKTAQQYVRLPSVKIKRGSILENMRLFKSALN